MQDKSRVDIQSGDLILEGRLRPAEGLASGGGFPGAVICHPHPQFGGSMENNVVYALEEHLARRGISTLAFNFRGVGRSAGQWDNMQGEVDDVVAALEFMAKSQNVDASRLGLAGYSFGGLMALHACGKIIMEIEGTGRDKDIGDNFKPRALVLISPMTPVKGWTRDDKLKALFESPPHTLVVAGTADQFCPIKSAQDLAVQIGPQARLVVVEGADHFYWGAENDAGGHTVDFMKGALCR